LGKGWQNSKIHSYRPGHHRKLKEEEEEEEITRPLEQMVEDRTRQVQEPHEKLLHQDKMSSLGKLSASVVHEINNPIADPKTPSVRTKSNSFSTN
jgi:C4-dicarboxylate-specific signal transduction histidine kinase